MVPTQEWSAQRKKLMKSSFPLKCGSWASPVSTLSGLAAVSELHTVTTGRVFTDRGRGVFKNFPGVFLHLLVHYLYVCFPSEHFPKSSIAFYSEFLPSRLLFLFCVWTKDIMVMQLWTGIVLKTHHGGAFKHAQTTEKHTPFCPSVTNVSGHVELVFSCMMPIHILKLQEFLIYFPTLCFFWNILIIN